MKTKTIQLRGTIRQIFPNATYKVEIDVPKKLEKSNKIDKEISQFCLCYLSGKITLKGGKITPFLCLTQTCTLWFIIVYSPLSLLTE